MKAIVAVDLNWGIGCGGQLLKRIPADMKFFKQKTLGNIVVMGRRTFESLPGKEPLKDRVNIVLTGNECFKQDNIVICHSLEALLLKLQDYPNEEIYVIGGEAVYGTLLPLCSEAYVTRIEASFPADKYFVNLDEMKNWKMISESQLQCYQDIHYRFLTYVNHQVKVPVI